jgi:hypothetical protein
MVGIAQKSHGARSGLYDGCSNGFPLIHFFQAEHRVQFRSRPLRFLGFSNHEKGAPRQEISKWLTVCSTFSRRGWSVVRSSSLAKGGTSKKRPSPHLHKVLTRSNKASPRTLQTALVHGRPVNPATVQLIMPNYYCYYGSLDVWTIACLTAIKSEPFMFSVLGFGFAYVSNIQIIVILYDFCVLPAYFSYKIVDVWNFERRKWSYV